MVRSMVLGVIPALLLVVTVIWLPEAATSHAAPLLQTCTSGTHDVKAFTIETGYYCGNSRRIVWYRFRGQKDGHVQITMRRAPHDYSAGDLDPYVSLEYRDAGQDRWIEVASNDDYGSNDRNARIHYTFRNSGSYRIGVSSYNYDSSGSYHLELVECEATFARGGSWNCYDEVVPW